MTISALPWFIMFILILSAGAISDKILHSGQSRFVARGLMQLLALSYLLSQSSLQFIQKAYM